MLEEGRGPSLTWRMTPDMMCILDREGRFYAVNPAWEKSLGWRDDEMVGTAYLDYLHPDDVDRSMDAFEVVKSGKPVLRFENRYRTNEGDYRWFSWVAIPVDERIFCTIRDVTDEKERVETIERQRAEAELRDQFLAVLGHDLRNPLSAINSGVRLLLRRVDDEASIDIIRQMQGSVARMAELIDNLMDLARVRLGGGIDLELAETSRLKEELEHVVDEIRLISPDAQIETAIDITQPVTCDVPRISQVLSNLLSNAVTHGEPTKPVRVQARTHDGELRICVVNEGEPIPDAAMEKLFQPFFRGEVRNSQNGLGLGLYIASEIAQAHDGTIEATSTEEETRFSLVLPL